MSSEVGASQAAGVKRSWVASMRTRVLSALVLIPVVIALVWGGGWWAFAGAATVYVAGVLELRGLVARREWPLALSVALPVGAVFLLSGMPFLASQRLTLTAIAITGSVVGVIGWIIVTQLPTQRAIAAIGMTVFAPFYLAWPLSLIILVRGDQPGYLSRGFWWLLMLLLAVWANDAAAYFTGHYLGRHQLSPTISPNKTWEGFFGGLVFTIIAVIVVSAGADHFAAAPLHIPLLHQVVLGALVCVVAVIGDLGESAIKRAVDAKDSGNLFPGHGGMLDRADSLLFAIYAIFFYALALGLLK